MSVSRKLNSCLGYFIFSRFQEGEAPLAWGGRETRGPEPRFPEEGPQPAMRLTLTLGAELARQPGATPVTPFPFLWSTSDVSAPSKGRPCNHDECPRPRRRPSHIRGTRCSPGEAQRGRQDPVGGPGSPRNRWNLRETWEAGGGAGAWWHRWENHVQRLVTQTAPPGRQGAGAPGVWNRGGGVGPEQVGALAFSEEPGRSERMPANLGAGFCIRLTKCSQTC